MMMTNIRKKQSEMTTVAQPPPAIPVVAAKFNKEELYVFDTKKIKVLGKGSFGMVFLTTRTSDKTKVVIKRAKAEHFHVSRNEVKVMQDLVHPNIVRIIDHFRSSVYVNSLPQISHNIVMEYCDSQSLRDAMDQRSRKEKHGFDESILHLVLAQSAYALYYCHAQHVLHRDLKADNILLHQGNIKLCDFGLSRSVLSTVDFATTTIGTPHYIAPEMVTHSPYNDRVDMWSLGILAFELMMMRKPFVGQTVGEVFKAVTEAEVPKLDPRYSLELRQLVVSLLDKNPTKRPSAAQILEYDWAKKVLDDAPLPDRDYVAKRKIRQTKAWERLNIIAHRTDTKMYEMVRRGIHVNVRAEPNPEAKVLGYLQLGSFIEVIGSFPIKTEEEKQREELDAKMKARQRKKDEEEGKEVGEEEPEELQWHVLTEGSCITRLNRKPLFEEIPEWRVIRPGSRIPPPPQVDLDDLEPATSSGHAELIREMTKQVSNTVTSDPVARKLAVQELGLLLGHSVDSVTLAHLVEYHHATAIPTDDTTWTVYACDYLRRKGIPLSFLRAFRAYAKGLLMDT